LDASLSSARRTLATRRLSNKKQYNGTPHIKSGHWDVSESDLSGEIVEELRRLSELPIALVIGTRLQSELTEFLHRNTLVVWTHQQG
jgi:hypothetical protein